MNWKLALLPVLIASAAPAAYAQPWLCTDADGNKAFNYEPESAHRKNCVDHPIPSGNVWRRHRASEWDAQEAPTAFPKVSAKVQKQRDVARRKILEHELAEEKKSLAAAI